MAGNTLTDAYDAVVELEVIGFQFSIYGENLQFQGTETEEFEGLLIHIPPSYLHSRLALIKEHKSEVINWLETRSTEDIVRSLSRVIDFVQALAETHQHSIDAWQRWIDLYKHTNDNIWTHFNKLYSVFVLLDARLNSVTNSLSDLQSETALLPMEEQS
jgi:hypothetical protein